MNILRVMGWHTNMAALMPPTHEKAFRHHWGKSFTKPTFSRTMNAGTHSHVLKDKDKARTATMLSTNNVT